MKKEVIDLFNIANLANQVLVGKTIEVFDSKNKAEIGIKGRCVEDRVNVLVIKTKKEEKTIIKKNAWFLIYVDKYKILVNGANLVGRIEKRIKK
ncbi:MAG: ribonuclease P protein subunit [Candidatus Pacearchaeota archaeon]